MLTNAGRGHRYQWIIDTPEPEDFRTMLPGFDMYLSWMARSHKCYFFIAKMQTH